MSEIQPGIIGAFTEAVVNTLGLSILPNTPIYIGQSNIAQSIMKLEKVSLRIRGRNGQPSPLERG